MPTLQLTIVIPIYNEEELIPELLHRLGAACDTVPDCSWRVIFVNDGSADRTRERVLQEREREPRFTLVDLSRNFGHQAAITAGLAHADADAVVVMDGDLQDPPEVIPELVQAWRDGGNIVMAVRRTRQEQGLRRLGFDLFHKLFVWLSDFSMEAQTGVFGLLDRRAVEEFNRLGERNRFFPGLRAWLGFDQRKVFYDRRQRAAGEPKQSFRRLFRYALDGIMSFSYKPLRLMTLAGLLISATGFVLALVFVIKRLVGVEKAEMGFTTLVTLILFLGGIQLMAIGLLGEYLARTYDEGKKRPLYIVRKTYGLTGPKVDDRRQS